MGKGKAVLLHLLAVAAGWGIVTAAWPGSAIATPSPASGKAPATTKSDRSDSKEREGSAIVRRLRQTLAVNGKSEPSDRLFSSLDSRLEVLLRGKGFASFDPAAARELALQELFTSDLRELLDGGRRPDLVFSFRRGEKDAEELLREVSALCPDASSAPDLRRALYTVLASHDPLRAEALLDPAPESELHKLRYAALASPSLQLSPDALLSVLRTLPEPADVTARRARIIAWEVHTRPYLSAYRDDYQHWVESLPPGLDRDLALAPLVGNLKKQQPAEADRLRQLIADPEIQARY